MIYFIVALLLFISFLVSLNKTGITPKYLNFLFLVVFMLFALRGIEIGGDTIKYVNEFTSNQYRGREIGYVLFCDLLRLFSSTPFVYLFFTSAISILPFFLLVRKHSNNPTLSLLYIFCFVNMTICFETHIRQNIGTGFILLSIYFWEKVASKAWKYWITPLLLFVYGVLCHSSLYITAPLCLLIPFIPISKKVAYYAIISAFIIGGVFDTLIVDFFDVFFLFIGDYDIMERISAYSGDGQLGGFEMSAFNVSNIILFSWMLFVVYASENDKTFYFKIFVVYAIVHCIFRTSDLAFRSFYLIQLLALVYIPMKIQKQPLCWVIICIFLLDWLQFLFRLCITPSMQNEDAYMFPYKFIFE